MDMTAFQRKHRHPPAAELDNAEIEWWNQNAALIERLWGLPSAICFEARIGYLTDIRDTFHRLLGEQSVTILEIACGSGWPGRLLSNESTKIVGLDFSEQQVFLAKTNAELEHNRFCRYTQVKISEMGDMLSQEHFDGAFVHCGLHHLDSDELKHFAATMRILKSGSAVVLVEPVYHDRSNAITRVFGKTLNCAYRVLEALLLFGHRNDPQLEHQLNTLVAQATNAGWFLSPKEMPFTPNELQTLFKDSFELIHTGPVTYFALRFAQTLAMLRDQNKAAIIGRKWLPVFRTIDSVLTKSGVLVRLTREYLFTSFVLIRT